MANINKPCGLRPIMNPYGNIQINCYKIVTGVAMYINSPVALNANGYMQVAGANSANTIAGSAVGFLNGLYGPIDSDYGYLPANPANCDSSGYAHVLVADDPNQLFVAQESTDTTALTLTSVGAGVSFAYQATTGNTTTGISNLVLRNDGVGTNTDQQLRLIKIWDKPDNTYGNNCKWIVKIANHQLAGERFASPLV